MIAASRAVKTAAEVQSDRTDWARELAAAQAWWREAGVDLTFVDEPTDWLGTVSPSPETPQSRGAQAPAGKSDARGPRLRGDSTEGRIGADRASWPTTLADFAAWWLTEPSLDPAPAARRVPPVGLQGAPLMVLVPSPEPDDRADLLSGRQGRLLDAILAAFGYARDTVYLASALPAPHPAPDWAELTRQGLGEVLAQHIALAAPQRLIVFGRDASPLLGHDPSQAGPFSRDFNHEGGSVPLAFAPALDAMLERPALKRGLWARWLEWTGSSAGT